MPPKYLNILALSAIVALACSFLPTPVTALSIDSNGLHARHAHIGQAFAKRAPKRCRAGPPPAAGGDPTTPATTPASTPAVTPANLPNTPATPNTPTTTPPAPAPSPNSGGKKAGLAFAVWDDTAATILNNFSRLSNVWAIYNWGRYKVENTGLVPVPMLSGPGNFDDWRANVLNTPNYATYVLGFNEPDHPQQANIDPASAITAWNQLILPMRVTNPQLVIISPAVTSGPSGEVWMDQFSQGCGNCFDRTAVHWYGKVPEEFIAYLERWHTRYGKAIWVTEFACMDFTRNDNYCTDAEATHFASVVTDFMNKTPWVEFYSPFVIGAMGNVDYSNHLVDPGLGPSNLAHIYFGY